jgi:hypothetical protein
MAVTPSMDSTLDTINPDETIVEKLNKLTDQYMRGMMTKIEFLEAIDMLVEDEYVEVWKTTRSKPEEK